MNNKSIGGTIIKLILLSLLVGVMLKFFHISPMGVLEVIPGTISAAFRAAKNAFSWGGEYILLGAVIVIPAYIILNLPNIIRHIRRKKE
jgi:hypothetical protein